MSGNALTSIRTEGALFSADFLQRLTANGGGLGGLTPDSYHLAGEQVHEAASRAWNRLIGAWTSFRAASAALAKEDAATTVTRERWLLPLFAELGFGRLQAAKALEIDGRSHPVSHAWHHVPLHLVGCGVPLDTRTTGVAGAARTSPHGLLQELLNRNDGMLWGVVSNGLTLRVLRDNRSLTRQAYVEFDLVAMMDGQAYADFVVLWLLCHQSRFEGERPDDCWLERWATDAHERGTRALDDLRDGVEQAIAALGRGFLAHPANRTLVEQLRTGALERQDYYRQLLRLVYRLIFLFVAEDRELLLAPTAATTARERYRRYYSVSRLRDLAAARRGTPHADLWTAITVVFQALGSDGGCRELGLPALGSFLWRHEAVPQLRGCSLANADLLDAVRALGFRVERNVRRLVDWRNLGPEELGSVYESLLELHPDVNTSAGTFTLRVAAGHERKTTGSYYTPTSLIECLLDHSLDPVLDEAARQPDAARAVLALKVCDPACGSGHFLIAAAHRIANRLAAVRTGDSEPAPDAVRTALRDAIGHCVYGVDINPMAVELCKVNLWLEALEPGRPLSFLDHHIQCGNALLGATPALLRNGIPDEAFDPIEGDDKVACRELKKRNKKEREGFRSLFTALEPWERVEALAANTAALNALDDRTPQSVFEKEKRYAALIGSEDYAIERLFADAWCTAFVQSKAAGAPTVTEDVFRTIERDPPTVSAAVRSMIDRLSAEYRFFHWHLAFPDVFHVEMVGRVETEDTLGWAGGFDVVLGNPPWDRITFEEREWFAQHAPEIAFAPNAARRRVLVARLAETDEPLFDAFIAARRITSGIAAFCARSGRFRLTAVGHLNTYALFTELASMALVSGIGRAALLAPTAVVTGDYSKALTRTLIESSRLLAVFDFDNRGRFFPAMQPNMRFALVVVAGRTSVGAAVTLVAAQLRHVTELSADRISRLSSAEVLAMNPETATLPFFYSARDASLVASIYRACPSLYNATGRSSWSVDFGRMLNMSDDSEAFVTLEELPAGVANDQFLPVYEAKFTGQYDHRAGTFAGISRDKRFGLHAATNDPTHAEKDDPFFSICPRYWIPLASVVTELGTRPYFLAYRDAISATADARSLAACFLPRVPSVHTLLIVRTNSAREAVVFAAAMNSFALDYVLRQKATGAHAARFIVRQLPFPSRDHVDSRLLWDEHLSAAYWIEPRVLELTYTTWDLEALGRDTCFACPPFRWNQSRRFLLRCELDAAFFHLYGIAREDVDYIMETFPIVKKNDEKAHGDYRTKRVILEIYDEMRRAIETNVAYMTRLDPPPADPRVAHPSQLLVGATGLDEFRSLPNRAWALPTGDWTEAALPILAAVLRSQGGPASTKEVRLASALALEPRLLTPSLDAAAAAEWLRLVGHDAAVLPSGVHAFAPQVNTAWGAAVKQLRGTGRLIEDAGTNTWSPGPGLESIDTTTWPDGRARFVWWAIRQRGLDIVVGKLPDAVRAWVNEEAA